MSSRFKSPTCVRLQPDEATTRSLDEAEQAARMYDANAATGNEVLDVVLTEKSLLCEAHAHPPELRGRWHLPCGHRAG